MSPPASFIGTSITRGSTSPAGRWRPGILGGGVGVRVFRVAVSLSSKSAIATTAHHPVQGEGFAGWVRDGAPKPWPFVPGLPPSTGLQPSTPGADTATVSGGNVRARPEMSGVGG
jgi:hypothetical protein